MIRLLFLVPLLFFCEKAISCSCAEYSVDEAFDDHEVVIIGTVKSFGEISFWEKLFNKDLPSKKANISITKNFKGSDQEMISVYTNYSSASCGVEFKEGDEYAVFAHRSLAEGNAKDKLFVDICNSTIHTKPREDFYEPKRKQVLQFLSTKQGT